MSSGRGVTWACGDDVVVAVELSELGDEVGADLACGSGYEDFIHGGLSFLLASALTSCPLENPFTLTLLSEPTALDLSRLGASATHRGRGDRSPPLILREPQHERPHASTGYANVTPLRVCNSSEGEGDGTRRSYSESLPPRRIYDSTSGPCPRHRSQQRCAQRVTRGPASSVGRTCGLCGRYGGQGGSGRRLWCTPRFRL